MTARHILLVSGPSGGGKSTFIRQLSERTLAPEIRALMPDHSEIWPVIEANAVLKGDRSQEPLFGDKSQPGGFLVHYDIVFIHQYGIKRYEDDPTMKLLSGADALHVVFVRPDCQVARRQYLDRRARHQQTKSKASLLWKRFVRRPMHQALASFAGKPTLAIEDLYAEHRWLAGCYQEWEAFIHRLAERHPNAKLCVVEPASGPGESAKFRLVTNPGATTPTTPSANE